MTINEQIATLWSKGLNTYEIAERLTRELREPFTEAHIYRMLHAAIREARRARGEG